MKVGVSDKLKPEGLENPVAEDTLSFDEHALVRFQIERLLVARRQSGFAALMRKWLDFDICASTS